MHEFNYSENKLKTVRGQIAFRSKVQKMGHVTQLNDKSRTSQVVSGKKKLQVEYLPF